MTSIFASNESSLFISKCCSKFWLQAIIPFVQLNRMCVQSAVLIKRKKSEDWWFYRFCSSIWIFINSIVYRKKLDDLLFLSNRMAISNNLLVFERKVTLFYDRCHLLRMWTESKWTNECQRSHKRQKTLSGQIQLFILSVVLRNTRYTHTNEKCKFKFKSLIIVYAYEHIFNFMIMRLRSEESTNLEGILPATLLWRISSSQWMERVIGRRLRLIIKIETTK